MSFQIRWEQCCETEGCFKPAHYGTLCASCFMCASPARRQVELDIDLVNSRLQKETPITDMSSFEVLLDV